MNKTLVYRGIISGDLNRGKNGGIVTGIYAIQSSSTIINGPSDFAGWGVFIQFPDNLTTQMILDTGGSKTIRIRKYAGSNPDWSSWA